MSRKRVANRVFTASAVLALTLLGAYAPRAYGSVRQMDAPVQITYTYPGNPQKDLQLVNNALNTILQKKINVTVKLNLLSWGDFDQKMKLAFASGQPCDVVFTAPWINNYYQLVPNGNLLALDDLLPKYAPNLWASMPKATWGAAKVNGHIYGVINQQMFPKRWGAEIRKDLAQKYHLDLNFLHTYADLEPFLAKLKANEPGIIPILSSSGGQPTMTAGETYGIDGLLDGVDIGVRANDRSLRVLNFAATPEFQKAVQLAYSWHQKGYMTKDPLPPTDAQAAFKAGKYAIVMDQAREGEIGKVQAAWGYDFVEKSFTPLLLTTGAVVATLNAVCKSSAHPVQDMQFLELLNSDKQVYNLMTRGIEGKHYVVVDKARGVVAPPKGLTDATDPYLPNTDWMFGNQFLAYYASEAEVGSWPLQAKINRTATPSIALGFAVNTDPIKAQVAQVSAVTKQYGLPLTLGLVDPAKGVPQLLTALKAAGQDKIIAEVQKQLITWSKTK